MKFCLLVVLCVIKIAAFPASADESTAFQFLALFNRVRTSQSLTLLTWNSGLAMTAQGLAEDCSWTLDLHWSSNHMTTYLAFSNRTGSPDYAFESWMREKTFTRNGNFSNCCFMEANHCCRYRTMVDKEVTSVGCGSSYCAYANWAIPKFPDLFMHICLFYPYHTSDWP